jgi:acyl-CoA synthetase (AMP-forming)/AMP-acid ligase II
MNSVSGHRLSTAEVESALILHKGVAETAVVGSHDDITGQAVFAFVTMKPEFDFKATKESELAKELAIQVRKVIGPFAAPKKIVSDVRRDDMLLIGAVPCERSAKDEVWKDCRFEWPWLF